MFGDPFLNFLDRHLAVVNAQDVVQHLLRGFQRDNAAKQVRMGNKAIERAFKFADVRRNLMGEVLKHLRRHRHAGTRGFGFQDRNAQFERRRMQVRDHAAAKPGAQPMIEPI